MNYLYRDDAVVFSNADYRLRYEPFCLFLISFVSISYGLFEFCFSIFLFT